MKKLLVIVCSLLLGLVLYSYYVYQPSIAPTIHFYYSPFIDKYICSSVAQRRIQPTWRAELKTKQAALQQVWDKTGPTLLAQTTKTIGKPFSYSNRDIPIFLCPNLPGISFPMMIPVRMYLKSAVQSRPWHDDEFVDMVYHELLHFYVFKALHWNLWTPLLRKYSNESFNVKIHLHLYALQKAVYLASGMEKDWRILVARSKELPFAYQRAIAIVEEEGYEGFVEELQGSRKVKF